MSRLETETTSMAATLFCAHTTIIYPLTLSASVMDCFQVAADVASMCLNSIANEHRLTTDRYRSIP